MLNISDDPRGGRSPGPRAQVAGRGMEALGKLHGKSATQPTAQPHIEEIIFMSSWDDSLSKRGLDRSLKVSKGPIRVVDRPTGKMWQIMAHGSWLDF